MAIYVKDNIKLYPHETLQLDINDILYTLTVLDNGALQIKTSSRCFLKPLQNYNFIIQPEEVQNNG